MDLTTDQIQQMIDDALQAREVANGFGVSIIPYHTHNGTDSTQIDYNNLLNKPTTASTPAASVMPFLGSLNETVNTYMYTFAFLDWTTFVSAAGSGAGVGQLFSNFGGDSQAPFLQATSPSITPTATIIHSAYYSPTTDFLLASEAATPTVYKYDSSMANEASLTISGTTIATCLGLTADSTYVYILVSTTAVKRFTLAGSTLTYVDTLTVATTERYLAVDGNYLYSMDATNSKYLVYNKATGATVATRSVGNLNTSNFRGMCIDPDGKLRQLMSSRIISSTSTNQWYLSRLSLI